MTTKILTYYFLVEKAVSTRLFFLLLFE